LGLRLRLRLRDGRRDRRGPRGREGGPRGVPVVRRVRVAPLTRDPRAGFVSPPSPASGAQLSYVPVWVTRAETPIVRMTPGPSVPRLQLSSAGVTVHVPSTGCVVTARNVTPLGAASETTTSCAWFGPLFLTTIV